MGLTVHYTMKIKNATASNIIKKLEAMRQLALDLPFDDVTEILQADSEDRIFTKWITLPWNKRMSIEVQPTNAYYFNVNPGLGCEMLTIGYGFYPKSVQHKYTPYQDQKFQNKEGEFSYSKWSRWAKKQPRSVSTFCLMEDREIRVPNKGISDFCKTEYANDPRFGGLENFLRCHIAVVKLLEKIGDMPGVDLNLEDEGHYGPSTYSDDWQEAREKGVKPTYVWHPATHDVAVLMQSIGESSAMIAALAGKLKDLFPGQIVAPITEYPNFEQLEFKGIQNAENS